MSHLNSESITILVTGFGPFGCHSVNASWEAVKLLPELLDFVALGIKLVIELIPVKYEDTLQRLSELWNEHKPLLIINVGVSDKARELTLESCAFKHGYDKPDVQGEVPLQKECCIGLTEQLSTNLDVAKLAADLNNLKLGVTCCTSNDAGRYLCEFSYCTSLSLNGQDSLFVHVPDIGKPYFPKETALGLCEIVRLAALQVKHKSFITDNVVNNDI